MALAIPFPLCEGVAFDAVWRRSCVHWRLLATAIQNVAVRRISLRERLENLALQLVAGAVGILPRSVARAAGAGLGAAAWVLLGRLRRVGMQNL